MKRQIRHGVFETNSSSCHSLSIRNSQTNYDYDCLRKFHLADDNTIHAGFGEFGWGYDDYTDPYNKLEYALTMIVETECRNINNVEEFFESEGFTELNSLIKDRCNCDGITVTSEMDIRHYHPTKWDDKKGKYVEDYSITEFYVDHYGYIDHQSCEGYESLQDFLDDYGVSLEDFIFNDGVRLIIDNDNH